MVPRDVSAGGDPVPGRFRSDPASEAQPQLQDSRAANDAHEQCAASSSGTPSGMWPVRAEERDPGTRRVLQDEHLQHDEDDRAQNQALECRARACPGHHRGLSRHAGCRRCVAADIGLRNGFRLCNRRLPRIDRGTDSGMTPSYAATRTIKPHRKPRALARHLPGQLCSQDGSDSTRASAFLAAAGSRKRASRGGRRMTGADATAESLGSSRIFPRNSSQDMSTALLRLSCGGPLS
jgi:hypothetical protein